MINKKISLNDKALDANGKDRSCKNCNHRPCPEALAKVCHDAFVKGYKRGYKQASDEQKERIDKINQADSIIFQTEKQMKELGDKIPADKMATVQAALDKLKEAHKAQDVAAIDTAINELNTTFQAAAQDLYNAQQQAGAQGGYNPGAQNANPGTSTKGDGNDVTDVPFEEVK